mgnify:FL=1
MLYQYSQLIAEADNLLKSKPFIQRLQLSSDLKRSLQESVASIRWIAKVIPDRTSLDTEAEFKGFHVFAITLKGEFLDPEILRAIDTAIPYPIIFEVISDAGIYVTATYKTIETGKGKVVLSNPYFCSEHYPADSQRQPLPPATSLRDLYEAIFKSLMPEKEREAWGGLPLSEILLRVEKAQKWEQQLQKLKNAQRREKQFKKKVELNQEIKQLEREIDRFYAGS